MLGRPDSKDPAETLDRVAAGGNAGYCFQHNEAFEVVLDALGSRSSAALARCEVEPPRS
jgi:arylamine N-acetyltransferase